jgi:diguanylate cyclase (GGDEF)-like protein
MSASLDPLRATVARRPLFSVSLIALYMTTGVLGLWGGFAPAGTTLLWLPSGIALGALLIFGYGIWPAVFASAAAVFAITGASVPAMLLLAAGHTLEALLAAYLVNRYASGRHALKNPRNCFRFAGVLVLAAVAVGATLNTASILLTGMVPATQYGQVWLSLCLGSVVGMLLAAPPIVLGSQGRLHWQIGRTIETVGMLFAVVLTCLVTFFHFPIELRGYPKELLCMPVLLWAAFRLGQRVSAAAMLVLATLAVTGTLLGYGPFVRATPFDSLLILQLFIASLAVMTTALAALSADYQVAESQLVEAAVTDPLTGLSNYRRLLEVISVEIARANRHQRQFAVVFFDMDGLKRINDELGHLTGSRAVCRLATTLNAALRTTDTAARYGGDEFVVVLSDTDYQGAALVVERTHERLADDPEEPRLSVSAGIAVYPTDGHTPTTLLSAADRALYANKSERALARRRGLVGIRESATLS